MLCVIYAAVMLNVIMLNVIMLSVIMLNVIMLNVAAPSKWFISFTVPLEKTVKIEDPARHHLIKPFSTLPPKSNICQQGWQQGILTEGKGLVQYTSSLS
jgi:hypothetical protein